MRARGKRVTLAVVLAGVLIFGPMAMLASAEELKFAHTMSPADSMNKAVLKFAEFVKERTGGALTVTVYPAGQLGKDPQILQGVRLGSIDIVMTGIPWHTSFAPWLGVLNLPYIFRDYEHAYRVLDGEIGQELYKPLETLGMKALGPCEIGFRCLTNSVRPVKTPEDVEGLKLRTTGDPYHVLSWKFLGAIPTPMPWPEVYMALKTGTVDGQENPVTLIHGAKLFEAQKYLSLTMHAYSASLVDMNLKKWKSLTSSQQKILLEAMRDAEDWHRKFNRELEGPILKEMAQSGMIIEKNPDKEAFAKVVRKPVQEEFAKKFGTIMIEKINQVR